MALSGQTDRIHFRLRAQELNTQVEDAYSDLIPISSVAINQHFAKVFRDQIGFLAQISQPN